MGRSRKNESKDTLQPISSFLFVEKTHKSSPWLLSNHRDRRFDVGFGFGLSSQFGEGFNVVPVGSNSVADSP